MASNAIPVADIDTADRTLATSFAANVARCRDVWYTDLKNWVRTLGNGTYVEQVNVCKYVSLLPATGVADFIKLGGYAHLVAKLQASPGDAELSKQVCLAIGQSVLNDRHAQESSGASGCVMAVLGVVQRFAPTWLDESAAMDVRTAHACTTQAALGALSNMTCNNETNKKRCIDNDGARVLFETLRAFSNTFPAFLVPACLALNNIVESPACKTICDTLGQRVVPDLVSNFSTQHGSKATDILNAQLQKLCDSMRIHVS